MVMSKRKVHVLDRKKIRTAPGCSCLLEVKPEPRGRATQVDQAALYRPSNVWN